MMGAEVLRWHNKRGDNPLLCNTPPVGECNILSARLVRGRSHILYIQAERNCLRPWDFPMVYIHPRCLGHERNTQEIHYPGSDATLEYSKFITHSTQLRAKPRIPQPMPAHSGLG